MRRRRRPRSRIFFFSSRRRHTRWTGDWSSDVCSSDLLAVREWFSVLVAGDPDAKPPRKPIGAKRAHKALQVLVLILGAAVEGKKLATNLAAGLKRLPKAQRREMYFLTAPQVEVLAEVVRE